VNQILVLIEKIKSGRLLSPATFDLDIEAAIDQRDQSRFEKEWLRVYQAVDSKRDRAIQIEALDGLREIAFKVAFEATAHPELAGYISDDFGLFGAALLIGFEDDWLNALWREYRESRFPRGELAPISGNLQDMVG
jgi:hypothetical protein